MLTNRNDVRRQGEYVTVGKTFQGMTCDDALALAALLVVAAGGSQKQFGPLLKEARETLAAEQKFMEKAAEGLEKFAAEASAAMADDGDQADDGDDQPGDPLPMPDRVDVKQVLPPELADEPDSK